MVNWIYYGNARSLGVINVFKAEKSSCMMMGACFIYEEAGNVARIFN